MKKWSVVLAGFFAFSSHAAAEIPSFADLKWLSSKETVTKQMTLKGYKYSEPISIANGSTDHVYKGKLLGYNVQIMNIFNKKNQLVKTVVIFTTDNNLYKLYTDFKGNLDEKYHEGIYIDKITESFRIYDSLLQSDLKNGKELWAAWTFDNGYTIDESFRQVYTNNSNLQLTINYYSPEWDDEVESRNNQNDL